MTEAVSRPKRESEDRSANVVSIDKTAPRPDLEGGQPPSPHELRASEPGRGTGKKPAPETHSAARDPIDTLRTLASLVAVLARATAVRGRLALGRWSAR